MFTLRSLWLTFATLSIIPSLLLYPAKSVAAGPWYQFEIIVFERINASAGKTEAWPADPGTPSRLNAIPLRIWPPKGGDRHADPVAYKALPKSEWLLTEHEQHLKRSRNYRPHLHIAWRQQMASPARAQLLHIELPQKKGSRTGMNTPAKIEGTLKVGVRRYLHLEADLLLRRMAMKDSADMDRGSRGFGPYYQPYRMQTSRRMRSGDLHYFDHPVIGMLFLATKYKRPEPPAPVVVEPVSAPIAPPNPAPQTPAAGE